MVFVQLFFVLAIVCESFGFVLERQVTISKPHSKSMEEWLEYFGVSPDPNLLEFDVVYMNRFESEPDKNGDEIPAKRKRIFPFLNPDLLLHVLSSVFNKPMNLVRPPNYMFNGNQFSMLKRNGDNVTEVQVDLEPCHYTWADNKTVASVSNCDADKIEGFVMDETTYIQLSPLSEEQAKGLVDKRSGSTDDLTEGWPHIIKKIKISDENNTSESTFSYNEELEKDSNYSETQGILMPQAKTDDPLSGRISLIMTEDPEAVGLTYPGYHKIGEENDYPQFRVPMIDSEDYSEGDDDDAVIISKKSLSHVEKKSSSKKTVEIAVFLDEAGYKLLKSDFMNDDTKITNAVLALVSGIQALYHQPSLGRTVDFKIVRLELFEKQPDDLKMTSKERDKMLTKFCTFNKKNNPKDDSDPKHWDIGLYLTGEDMYSGGNRISYSTMGLAVVDGVCREDYSCVIVELGVTNQEGLPYPSTGFGAAYTAAHEIGHNLGMKHDGSQNNCDSDSYLMSPRRGTVGKVKWSQCSSDVIVNMKSNCLDDGGEVDSTKDHEDMYHNNPGQKWDVDKQCQMLLKDSSASLNDPMTLKDVCNSLYCKSSKKLGVFSAGPALPGTFCGDTNWCQEGKCVPWGSENLPIVKGGWSEWSEWTSCSDSCVEKSIGVKRRTRQCNNPPRQNSLEGCDGAAYEIEFCETECSNRVTSTAFASQKCSAFSGEVSGIKGSGIQFGYTRTDESWVSCGIFCELSNRKSYYCPRDVMNNAAMFPEGTWCFNDGKSDYYCLQNSCQPKDGFRGRVNSDMAIDILREAPTDNEADPKATLIREYLSKPTDESAFSNEIDPMKENVLDVGEDYVDAEKLTIPDE